MQQVVSIVGVVSLFLIAGSVFLGALGYLLERVEARRWEREKRLRRDHLRDLGVDLCRQAYWFTESVEAWKALESLGEWLRDEGSLDISKTRDMWRQAVAKEKSEGVPLDA